MSKDVMQGVLGLLAVGCVLAMSATAGADFTVKNSADFDWKYDMVNTPDVEDLDSQYGGDFTVLGSGTLTGSTDGDILTMSTPATGWAAYENCQADQTWQLDPNITHANGYTYEVRLQITGGTTPQGFVFLASTEGDNALAWLNVAYNGTSWASGGTDEPPLVTLDEADNTDAFHVFRVAQAPGEATYSVWRDGVLLSDSLGTGFLDVAVDKIAISDNGSKWGGTIDIDYFRFISGAWAPDYTPPPDPIPGDANEDDVVNDQDASILAAHWQYGPDAEWGDGDFNDDGVVNDQDASILAAHWQETREGAAPVPEPLVLVLLFGAGLIGLLARARRRR